MPPWPSLRESRRPARKSPIPTRAPSRRHPAAEDGRESSEAVESRSEDEEEGGAVQDAAPPATAARAPGEGSGDAGGEPEAVEEPEDAGESANVTDVGADDAGAPGEEATTGEAATGDVTQPSDVAEQTPDSADAGGDPAADEEAEVAAAPEEPVAPAGEQVDAPPVPAGPVDDAAEGAATPSRPAVETGAPAVSGEDDRPRGEDTLIAANGDTTCAVLPDGGVSCWGADGLQHRLAAAGFDDVVAVTISDRKFGSHSTAICALHRTGTVSCWGDGHDGRMGQGDDFGALLPVGIPGITDATGIAAGAAHFCALHADGGVSCWGQGADGQMGDGTNTTRRSPFRVPAVQDIVSIAAGYARTCGVHSDGTVSCWGKWTGDGYRATPSRMSGYEDVVSLAAGVFHLCAVHADGRVSCSRYDPSGRDTTPRSVPGIDDAVAVSAGEGSFCALHRDGGVSCWGRNHDGQVGDGTTEEAVRPVRLGDVGDAVAVTVSGPNRREDVHACARRSGGGAYCWGNNGYGQLGTGDREDRLVPTAVPVVEGGGLDIDWLPATPAEFVHVFVELMVTQEEDEFPWLRAIWDRLRGNVFLSEMGTFGGSATHACLVENDVYRCEALRVEFNTRFGVDVGIIAHEFAHAYDAQTGLAPRRAWGAVQLYFNVTYKDCFPEIESIGGEYLADTMSHLIEPASWLTYYESTDIPSNGCARYTPEPTRLDEEVALAGLAGEIPDWYTENITDGAELWSAFLSRPGDKLFANIMHEFGGLCSTSWVRHPLDPSLFPPEGTNPFRDGGC